MHDDMHGRLSFVQCGHCVHNYNLHPSIGEAHGHMTASKPILDLPYTYKTCNNGTEINIQHLLFTCTALNDIRTDEYVKLERKFISINRIDVWELFMSSNLDVKLNLTLGIDVLINQNKCDADNIAIIFDDFCKSYQACMEAKS